MNFSPTTCLTLDENLCGVYASERWQGTCLNPRNWIQTKTSLIVDPVPTRERHTGRTSGVYASETWPGTRAEKTFSAQTKKSRHWPGDSKAVEWPGTSFENGSFRNK